VPFPHEPLEVRERLGDREPSLGWAELGAEHDERDVIGGPRLGAECGTSLVEPVAVVVDQLAGARRRVVDRLAVSGIHDPRGELDCSLQ